jgi:hypothetical protein
MDIQVKETIVKYQAIGNLAPVAIRFYDETKPEVTKTEGRRTSFLRYKAKDGKKRESMAVEVPMFDADGFSSKSEHDFLNGLVADYHDSLVARCADGEITSDEMESKDWMVKDYFDTSRDSSGRKITKENIMEWYLANVGGTVAKRALAKNAQMKDETVANVVKGFGEMFQRFTKYDLVSIFTAPQFALMALLLNEVRPTIQPGDAMLEWIDGKMKKISELTTAQDSLVDAI